MPEPALELLDSRIRKALLTHRELRELRPIQRLAIPPLVNGENALLLAGTAGGKTEAMLWPLLTRLAAASVRSPTAGAVRLLLLAPLKALLNDLEKRVAEWADKVGFRCFKWHGDVDRARKSLQRERPHEVLLTTPESLEVIVTWHQSAGAFFGALDAIVVDEAHYFAENARGAQLACLIERVSAEVGRDVQRVGLSATVGNPDRVLAWLAGSSDRPRRVIEAPRDGPNPQNIEVALHASQGETSELLVRTCGGKRTIVFVPSRRQAEAVAALFVQHRRQHPRDPIPFDVHHSSVSKSYRERAERQIRMPGEEGKRAIISTATLELGIDIGRLDDTVQIGPPRSAASHLQRMGRTGRRPGTLPSTHIVLDADDPDEEKTMTSLLLTVATVRLGLAGRVEDVEPSRSNFALLAHQLICLSLQRAGVTAEEAFEVLRRADPCAEIREDELTELVEHLLSTGILRRVDHLLLLGDEGEKRLGRAHLRELYSVFDSPPVYVAKHGSQEVGTLDLVYVLARKKLPFVIILAGRFWEVVGRDDKRRILRVRPCTHARAPAWHSKRPPFSISRLVAQEVRRVVLEAPSIALDRIRLNGPARAWLSGLGEIQDWQRIAHERVEVDPTTSRTAVLWTYGGDHLNWLLGRFLEATAGLQVVESDSRRIAVAAPEGGAGSCEEVILQALRSLGEMSESARTELSLAFAKDLVDFRITKYDDLIPPSLRAAEQARGLASLAHLRCLAG